MNSGKRRTVAWALAASLTAMTAIAASPPARAQDTTVQEIRLRKLEAEIRSLQRAGPSGIAQAANPAIVEPGIPAVTPLTDLLTRMDAIEAQMTRLTAQNEEMANHQRQIDAKLVAITASSAPAVPVPALASPLAAPVPTPVPTPVSSPISPPVVAKSAVAGNLAAMTGGASERTSAEHPSGPAHPSAQRVAAVKAVIKPETKNAGLDDYSYGFRLYTAKFYPEAAQQLKFYIDKYPTDAHISYARNLLGRAYLDDGKPRDAAPWFLMNYKTDAHGARAADSLLNLADAMHQLGDNTRACIALNEFATTYAPEAKGRLRRDYDKARGGLTCN